MLAVAGLSALGMEERGAQESAVREASRGQGGGEEDGDDGEGAAAVSEERVGVLGAVWSAEEGAAA